MNKHFIQGSSINRYAEGSCCYDVWRFHTSHPFIPQWRVQNMTPVLLTRHVSDVSALWHNSRSSNLLTAPTLWVKQISTAPTKTYVSHLITALQIQPRTTSINTPPTITAHRRQSWRAADNHGAEIAAWRTARCVCRHAVPPWPWRCPLCRRPARPRPTKDAAGFRLELAAVGNSQPSARNRDSGYMCSKIRKFRTHKFDTWNKRKFSLV